MNTRSPLGGAVALLLFGARAANAACVISGARPTVPLPTMAHGQEFSFVATDDCQNLRFKVPGFIKHASPGPDVGSKNRTYKVNLTANEWNSLIDESDTTFRWSIVGVTNAGVMTQVWMKNELDFDHDGWTRSEGDVGTCDDSSAINPGVPEICDGIDQDCDQLIDEDLIWFRDADGDGYGDDANTRCGWAEGYVDVGGDCDDSDSDAWCPELDLAFANAKLVGQQEVGWAGYSVSGAGDVDGDGHDDLLIGAPDTQGDARRGAAYLVRGPVTGTLDLSLADATLVGERLNDLAGTSVSGAGDVNNDGHDDLLIGAPGNVDGGRATGAAYLVLGPVSGMLDLSLADAEFMGEASGAAGSIVSGAGDVDSDGHDDLLVASHHAAYVLLGPVTGNLDLSLADAKLEGGGVEDSGPRVAGAGDVDGDGNDDMLVGAHLDDEGDAYAGAAYLVLGPVSGSVRLGSPDAKLVGEERYDNAGYSVSGAGDADGDGYADLLIGAQGSHGGGSYSGAAYLVLGPVMGTRDLSLADAKLVGEPFDYAGVSVSGAGDWNGDNLDDLLIGAVGNDHGGSIAGAAYLVLSPVSGTIDLSLADVMLVGEDVDDHAGRSVSGAGDVDGDGLDDVLVGAYDNDAGGTDAGAAYLLYGGSF